MDFYNNTKIQLKSNNKRNNYTNRLLRFPLLKYTHTYKNDAINKKRQYNFPHQGKSTPATPTQRLQES